MSYLYIYIHDEEYIYIFKVKCTYKHVTVDTVMLIVTWSNIQCVTVFSSCPALGQKLLLSLFVCGGAEAFARGSSAVQTDDVRDEKGLSERWPLFRSTGS